MIGIYMEIKFKICNKKPIFIKKYYLLLKVETYV